jgi:hypothetical protein
MPMWHLVKTGLPDRSGDNITARLAGFAGHGWKFRRRGSGGFQLSETYVEKRQQLQQAGFQWPPICVGLAGTANSDDTNGAAGGSNEGRRANSSSAQHQFPAVITPTIKNPRNLPMDREIQARLRLSRRGLVALPAAVLLTLILVDQIPAQDRGFGRRGGGFQPPQPEELFSRLDANNDGTLSATELNNSFMSRFLRDIDASNGLSREQFAEQLQQMRERRGWGGGRDGDRGRDRDRDRDDENRSDDRSGENESSSGENSSEGNGSAPAGGPTGSTTATATPRPRVTIDLQADLLGGDTDRDGQVGLYEWRRFAGRSLREFHQLDLNRDGFVTPREYATARPASTPAATPTATAAAPAAQPAPTASTESSGNGGATPSNNSPTSASQPADERTTQDAARFFRLLDKNKDGQIAPEEWEDGRIRTMFTKDGIDLNQPLPAADFSRHYARLSPNE